MKTATAQPGIARDMLLAFGLALFAGLATALAAGSLVVAIAIAGA